jgi:hypothetical protein
MTEKRANIVRPPFTKPRATSDIRAASAIQVDAERNALRIQSDILTSFSRNTRAPSNAFLIRTESKHASIGLTAGQGDHGWSTGGGLWSAPLRVDSLRSWI